MRTFSVLICTALLALCVCADNCLFLATEYNMSGNQKLYSCTINGGVAGTCWLSRTLADGLTDIDGYQDRLWGINGQEGVEYQMEEGPNTANLRGAPRKSFNLKRADCEPVAVASSSKQETGVFFLCEDTTWWLCSSFDDKEIKCLDTEVGVVEDTMGFILDDVSKDNHGFIFASSKKIYTFEVDDKFTQIEKAVLLHTSPASIRGIARVEKLKLACVQGNNSAWILDFSDPNSKIILNFPDGLDYCSGILVDEKKDNTHVHVVHETAISSYRVLHNNTLQRLQTKQVMNDTDLRLTTIATCESYPIVVEFEAEDTFTNQDAAQLVTNIAALFQNVEPKPLPTFELVHVERGRFNNNNKRAKEHFFMQINLSPTPNVEEFFQNTCDIIEQGNQAFTSVKATLSRCDLSGDHTTNSDEQPVGLSPITVDSAQPTRAPAVPSTTPPVPTATPSTPVTPTASSEDKPSSNTASIVVSVVVVFIVIVLAVLVLILVLFFRHTQKEKKLQKKTSRYKTMNENESQSSNELEEKKVVNIVNSPSAHLNDSHYARVEAHVTGGAPPPEVVSEESQSASRPQREESRPMALSTLVGRNWFLDFSELTIGKKLGSGSFGVVRKAKWRYNDVAVKFCSDVGGVEEFIAEVKLMIDMRPHDNVVRVFGVCRHDSTMSYVLIMDYMAGGSLDKVLYDNSGALSLDEKKDIIAGVAKGLHHLHLEGVIHRDLAARNVLLDENNVPKISDFGMSRVLESQETVGATKNTSGPIKWMAPENMRRQYSKSSDVWSFACLLFEVFHEKPPWSDRQDMLQLALDIREKGATPPIDKERTPTKYQSLMRACWSMQPQDRPTMTDICKQLIT